MDTSISKLKISDPKVLVGLAMLLVFTGWMVMDPLAGFICVVLPTNEWAEDQRKQNNSDDIPGFITLSVPPYAEVPPHIEAKRIISCISTICSYYSKYMLLYG
jgi:hypothetical protein